MERATRVGKNEGHCTKESLRKAALGVTVITALALAKPPLAEAESAGSNPSGRAKAAVGPVERTLPNGLTVIVEEDHRTPLVSLALRYRAGEANVPPPFARGTATVATALMVRATEHVPEGEYAKLLARAGASKMESWTSADAISFGVTLPAEQLALPLWLWSDQMAFFDKAVDDTALATARARFREQRRGTFAGSPLARIHRFAYEELYPVGHPYHDGADEAPEAVDAVTREGVLAYHERCLTPDRAILSIVGHVTTAEVFEQVGRYFGPIPRGTTPPLPVPEPVGLSNEIQIDLEANIKDATISVFWATPRLLTTDDAELDVVARLLAGQQTAYLWWALVDEKKVARTVRVRQMSGQSGSVFQVAVEAVSGVTAPQLLSAFDAAIDAVKMRHPTPNALRLATYELLVHRVHALDGAATKAYTYASYAGLVGTASYLLHDFERYDHIANDPVVDALARLIPRDRRVVLLVTPSASAPPGGERKGRRVILAARQ